MYLFSILFATVMWTYRFIKINSILQHGVLGDFVSYYDASRTIILGHINTHYIVSSSFGPPFVFFPYVPFAIFPFKFSEYLITILNIICYYLVFYLLWKRFMSNKLRSFFWIYIGILSFSFPIIFSFGTGNPIGIVTLSMYSVLLFPKSWKQWVGITVATILKLFPIILLPLLVISVTKKNIKILGKSIFFALLVMLSIGLLTFVVFPHTVWALFIHSSQARTLSSMSDPAIYNQSFSSTLARLGLHMPSFSLLYILFVAFASLLLLVFLIREKNSPSTDARLYIFITLLSFILLIHPIAWQYYFAIYLPFLMLKLGKNEWLYLFPFILMSINGAWFPLTGFAKGIIDSSQFWGNLSLFLLLTLGAHTQKD